MLAVGNTLLNMGQITIKVMPEQDPTPPDVGGKIGVLNADEQTCQTTWQVRVAGSCFVEFIIGSLTIQLDCVTDPFFDFANGEQITSDYDFLVTIEGYRSPQEAQNTISSSCTVRTFDTQGGSQLRIASLQRDHTSNLC